MATHTYERRKVYDGILRGLHAWNGLAIIGLLVTAWVSELFEKGPGEKTIWLLHIFLGYALIAGFAARIIWGLFGPRHARFSGLWHPQAWFEVARKGWRAIRQFEGFGHHPLASIAYLCVYLVLCGMSVTGIFLAAIEHGQGPLANRFYDDVGLKHFFKEPHELGAYSLLGFIVIHLAALIFHEWKGKTPVAQSMITGYQYRLSSTPAEEKTHETQNDIS